MAGIQISGLLSNQAFDWKSVVDQLIAADSVPVTTLQTQKTTNTSQITALSSLSTSMLDLQNSVQQIRSDNIFAARSVDSNVATTWKSTSSTGAALGAYTFNVTQLATNASLRGKSDIGAGLSTTTDVSGTTLANLPVATPITAGNFSVNGQQITVALTDSLKDIFDKISTATGGDVTGSYDPSSDGITLSSAGHELIMGATNDTSNFLSVMKLNNTGTGSASSSGALGTVVQSATLANSGLRGAVTNADSSGNSTFSVNGVSIAYNVNTDSVGSILARINNSGAGVTATYDPANDRVNLTNNKTGDVGIGLNETGTGILSALGLSGTDATFTHGKNAQFTLNNGALINSTSNTLDSSVHGIAGLSVTVNSTGTQTLTISADTSSMQTDIQNFLDKFNALQDAIDTNTKTSSASDGTVTTSVLSNNREVQSWASQLQSLAFNAIPGLTGTVQRMDNLGIDFDSTTGHLTIKDSGKLNTALSEHPDDVQSFFLTPSTGMVSQMFTSLTNLMANDSSQQSSLSNANTDLDTQIATLQSRLDSERTDLTNAFVNMLDAQSNAQSQTTYLTAQFFKSSSS